MLHRQRQPRISWTLIVLALIVILALGLRLNGLDWDSGYGFHPDERDIYMRAGCMYEALTANPGYATCGYLNGQPQTVPGIPSAAVFLDPEKSPLNPHWFPLGSMLIYLMVILRFIVELFTDISALDMRYAGRTIAALADVGSVLMVFVLGRRLYGGAVGLLAAGLTAVAVIHVQNSHFFRPETMSVLFTLIAFWAMLRMVERRRLVDSVILGLAVGLTMAPKVSGLPLVLPLALAYGYRLWDVWSPGLTPPGDSPIDSSVSRRQRWLLTGQVIGQVSVAAVLAAAVFLVSSPYSLLDFQSFAGDVAAQGNMARHAGLWPFTVQYVGTEPFLYQFKQSAVFGLGLPLGIVAWLAIPFTAVLSLWPRKTRRADLLILFWLVGSLMFLESFEVRFLRYVFPLMPFMILLGSRMLLWLVETGRWAAGKPVWLADLGRPEAMSSLRSGRRGLSAFLIWAPVVLVLMVVGATVFYSLAFQRVYTQEHPAVRASNWINQNVPPGTAIVSDNHWDEFVPDLYSYRVWQYPLYEGETPAKMETLALKLAESKYLVFYSNRPYTSVSRDPQRFPFSTNYHQMLFAGQLGYRLEKSFTSYPSLLGVEFRDDPLADAGLARPQAAKASKSDSWVSFNLGYADDNVTGYDHPLVLLFRNVDGFSQSEILDNLLRSPPAQDAAAGTGLMLSEAQREIQRSGGTWSSIIDRSSWTNRLPVLAWLLVVELVYLVTLPLAIFIFRPLPDRGIVFARILGLLAVAYLAWLPVSLGWIGFSRTAIFLGFQGLVLVSSLTLVARWDEIREFVSQKWRLLLTAEVLFLLAFLAFTALRAANPDLWHPWRGGEKPMELAYFNAVIRSTSMPPFDPWFAGGYLNYYYWGYFIPAVLVKVTGIIPTTAFNLAVPLFFALTVTGAYSLVYNLAEGVRRGREHESESTGYRGRRSWRPSLASPMAAGLLGGVFIAVMGNLDGIVQIAQGVWRKALDWGAPFPAFDFWRSSRMMPVNQENFDPSPLAFWVPDKIAGSPEIAFHITEFPFFTFLFADLHAHMMVIPFTLLVIGLGLNLVAGLSRQGRAWTIIASIALGLALGALWVVNSWDYPSYLILVLALTALAVYFRPGPTNTKVILAALLSVGVVVVSLAAFWPFHQSYEAFNTGLDVSKWRTPIDRYLVIHGLFLFVIASFLIFQTAGPLRGMFRSGTDSGLTGRTPKWLLGSGSVMAVFLAAAGYWTAAMLAGFLTVTALAFWMSITSAREERRFESVALVLLAMALAISMGVDFVRIEGDIGRMNTLFKYYLEIWVLFSVVSAYMVWRLLAERSLAQASASMERTSERTSGRTSVRTSDSGRWIWPKTA
ncbi:MAG: glycosyltransferase family 39 protein, partial [Chloroflexi bacterium]|nr:glycosyltransferase family 39 protein [Chloroflexota bacterium]